MSYLNDTPDTPPTPPQPAPEAPKKRMRWGKVAALTGVILASGFVGFGIGRVSAFHRFAQFMGYGPGMSMGGLAGDRMDARAEFVTSRFLSRVDATPEQKEKISIIVRNAMSELQPLRERHRAARIELTNALSGTTVDRARIEQMRITELATADTLSRKVADYLATAAEVLTPTQRQQLADRMKERRNWRQS
jgi:periplasmic protein CpxP/Spy